MEFLHKMNRGDYMNVCELTTSVTLLALTTSSELSDEELRLFISILIQFQYTLNTVLVARSTQRAQQEQQQQQEQQEQQEDQEEQQQQQR